MEQNVNKIKELLKSNDFDEVNRGLDLAQALNEEAIYERLLEGCGVNEEGKLVNEKKEISDYLVCTLSSLSDGPKAKEITVNITTLNLEGNFKNVDGLCNFPSLTKLTINYCAYLTNVDGLTNLTNLKHLDLQDCWSLTNINGISKLNNLSYLN